MKSVLFSAVALSVLALGQPLGAQNFQPRGSRTTDGSTARPVQPQPSAQQQAGVVSADLLQLYARTQAVRTEDEVTLIARSCSKVLPDTRRSKADREYASSLLAWALNRRGEMRSEQAAKLVEQGQVQEAAKLDKLAADDFETAVEYAPGNWRTRHNLAISLAMKGDYRRAIDQLTHSIELKPDYANARFNRAELYFELQQYQPAIDDYSEAIELNGNDPQYFNSRGHCRFMLESYEDAIADYQRAAELGSDSAVYRADLADAYQFLGRWEEAAQAYRAAVSINNSLPRAYQNAAWLMATCPDEKLRNVELALSAAKKAIDVGGGLTPQTLDTLAAATAAAGRYQEAVKLQKQAIEMSPDEDERVELSQRLELYQRGQPYVQPRSLAALHRAEEKIRTASSAAASASVPSEPSPR